jgi:hypothetical protein
MTSEFNPPHPFRRVTRRKDLFLNGLGAEGQRMLESNPGGNMTIATRHLILRANAIYLGVSAAAGLLFMDLPGVLFGTGPGGRVIANAPHSAIGFVEAHGLAFILAVLFWRAEPTRAWHLTGVAQASLLGISNLVFWQIFIAGDALVMGYVTTSLHLIFALLQMSAAIAASSQPAARHGIVTQA